MTTLMPVAVKAVRALPEDLRRRLGSARLLHCVLEAVQTVAPPAGTAGVTADVNPRMLLTLLTYCYCSEIAGSDDVEWATTTDATAHYICAGRLPPASVIRQFRRTHRLALEQCLVRTLTIACVSEWTPRGGEDRLEDGALPGAVPDRAALAEIEWRARRLLTRAIQMDTAASE
jgi:hypothetical protein